MPLAGVSDPFAPVVGQQAAVAALSALLRRGGGAGTTLLWGPDGVGRFLLAHRTACAILGDSPASFARVEGFHHPDLHVVEPGDGIDGVRAAREAIARRAVEGPRPVLLLRDADRLHLDALNALLKTMEEPPSGAAVILVAESPELLPATVVSRCARVRARPLDRAAFAEVLRRNGRDPGDAADAEGSAGRALYHHEAGIAESVASLLPLLQGRAHDPLGEAEKLARARGGEKPADLRRRLGEVLRVAATRLRRDLPASEFVVRALMEGLGSLQANANPGIVMAHLVVQGWKRHGN